MTNRNPFEIRADLLKMAQDYLVEQYHANLNFMREFQDKAVETMATPVYPTMDNILEQAQKFYSFVTKQ